MTFSRAASNLSEISNLTSENYIQQQATENGLTWDEQAELNQNYLTDTYGTWIILGKTNSVFNVSVVNFKNAIFGYLGMTYLICAIVFAVSAPICGKILFPQLAKMYKDANEQLTDLATLETNTIVKEKKNKKEEWF